MVLMIDETTAMDLAVLKSSKNQTEGTSKVIRIIQTLFDEKNKKISEKRAMAEEIEKFLSNTEAFSCSNIVSSFLKGFVSSFGRSEMLGEFSLKNYTVEIDLLEIVVDRFPGAVHPFRTNLLMIILKDLSHLSVAEVSWRQKESKIKLFVKIVLAGKWSAVNSSSFRLHYASNVSHLCESVYHLCYKHEIYKDASFKENAGLQNELNEIKMFCTKEDLLKLSEHAFIGFVTCLISILKHLVSVKVDLLVDLPVNMIFDLCRRLLQYAPPEDGGVCPFWSIQRNTVSLLDVVLQRCGTLCLPAMKGVVATVDCYLKSASNYLSSLNPNQMRLDEHYLSLLTSVLYTACTIIRKVSRYCFSEEYLDSVLLSSIKSCHRFVLFHEDFTESVESQPKAKKRKQGCSTTSGNQASEVSLQLFRTSQSNSKQLLNCFIVDLLGFCSTVLCECSNYISPATLHEVYNKVAFIAMAAFPSQLGLGKDFLSKYPNFSFLVSSSSKCALLELLQSMVLRPNPKCTPPLSIIADVFANARNSNDQNVVAVVSRSCKVLDNLFKPNSMPPFGSVLMQYEPNVETTDVCSQTEKFVEFQNAYTQTIYEVASHVSENSNRKRRPTKSIGSQTTFKTKQTAVVESSFVSETEKETAAVDSKIDPCLQLDDADFESFSSICEQFFPSVV